MAYILNQYNRKNGVTYVYRAVSHWDKEKKMSRQKKKLIGKLDADGNVVPTGKRGRPRKNPIPDAPAAPEKEDSSAALRSALLEARERIVELEAENRKSSSKVRQLERKLDRLVGSMEDMTKTLNRHIADLKDNSDDEN